MFAEALSGAKVASPKNIVVENNPSLIFVYPSRCIWDVHRAVLNATLRIVNGVRKERDSFFLTAIAARLNPHTGRFAARPAPPISPREFCNMHLRPSDGGGPLKAALRAFLLLQLLDLRLQRGDLLARWGLRMLSVRRSPTASGEDSASNHWFPSLESEASFTQRGSPSSQTQLRPT